MKSMYSLLEEYQDVKSSLHNRIIGMKEAFEEVMDDNDFHDLVYDSLFMLPAWNEELMNVYMINNIVISNWESNDPEWATGTTWRIPVECFSMDREQLHSFVKEKWKEGKAREDERVIKRLKREAEDIGYELKLKLEKNNEY